MRTQLAFLALISAAGCASDPASTPSSTSGVNTGLNSLLNKGESQAPPVEVAAAKPTEVDQLVAQKVDVQSILDAAEPAPPPVPEVKEEPKPEVQQPEPQPEPAPPPKSLQERIDETSLLLIDLLRQDATSNENTLRSALALAAMEAVRPGSAPKVITPDTTDGGPLPDDQRALVNAFRDVVAGLASVSQDKAITPDALTEKITDLADRLIATRPMRINATIAAKVTGFGQFMSLGNGKFQQGKPVRAIIYTEVRRFSQRVIKEGDSGRVASAAQPGDKWAVELTQELQLIHDADGVKAWQRPEQTVIETSRNQRRDFYLVQDVTLPSTLSIGAYKLKVIVRDRVGGQVDEAIIPLEVVADPALVSGSGANLYD